MFRNTTQTELLEETDVLTEKDLQLVLWNDDVNTFDFVIETLVKLCGHEPEQAEQCAYIVHYKGKCIVKSGSFEQLVPVCSGLLDRGLSATIE